MGERIPSYTYTYITSPDSWIRRGSRRPRRTGRRGRASRSSPPPDDRRPSSGSVRDRRGDEAWAAPDVWSGIAGRCSPRRSPPAVVQPVHGRSARARARPADAGGPRRAPRSPRRSMDRRERRRCSASAASIVCRRHAGARQSLHVSVVAPEQRLPLPDGRHEAPGRRTERGVLRRRHVDASSRSTMSDRLFAPARTSARPLPINVERESRSGLALRGVQVAAGNAERIVLIAGSGRPSRAGSEHRRMPARPARGRRRCGWSRPAPSARVHARPRSPPTAVSRSAPEPVAAAVAATARSAISRHVRTSGRRRRRGRTREGRDGAHASAAPARAVQGS